MKKHACSHVIGGRPHNVCVCVCVYLQYIPVDPTSLQSVSGAEILAGIDMDCGTGIAQAQPSVHCPWREISFTLLNSPQEWEGRVPCGTPHATLYITLTTVLFTLCCAGYILHALLAVSKEQTINQEQTRAGIKTLTS